MKDRQQALLEERLQQLRSLRHNVLLLNLPVRGQLVHDLRKELAEMRCHLVGGEPGLMDKHNNKRKLDAKEGGSQCLPVQDAASHTRKTL